MQVLTLIVSDSTSGYFRVLRTVGECTLGFHSHSVGSQCCGKSSNSFHNIAAQHRDSPFRLEAWKFGSVLAWFLDAGYDAGVNSDSTSGYIGEIFAQLVSVHWVSTVTVLGHSVVARVQTLSTTSRPNTVTAPSGWRLGNLAVSLHGF